MYEPPTLMKEYKLEYLSDSGRWVQAGSGHIIAMPDKALELYERYRSQNRGTATRLRERGFDVWRTVNTECEQL